MKKIVLASGSPRRKELLGQIRISCDVITSDVVECTSKERPEDIVMELSMMKVAAVYEDCMNSAESDKYKESVFIGADTIVYHDGVVLGKPKDKQDAYLMIQGLQGKTHQVYTGVSYIYQNKRMSFYEKTNIDVYDMTEQQIEQYIDTKEPYDKAGAYGIQGLFGQYVKRIEGDYNNVVGLPVARLMYELRKAGIE